MNITDFEMFLTGHKEAFAYFLKGCKDLESEQMRTVLAAHQAQMDYVLITAFPIGGGSLSSPMKPQTPQRATKQPSTSPWKSPAPTTSFQSGSPPASSHSFKPHGPVQKFTRSPSIFKQIACTSSPTSSNTPTSKKTRDPELTGSSRAPSIRRGGMTIGGAGRLFRTPRKGYAADDSDSSAGSPISEDLYYKDSSAKKFKKSNAPPSPFAIAAHAAEINAASKTRKQGISHSDSSTDDFEIPIIKSTVRKASSTKGKKTVTPKKALWYQMDLDGIERDVENDEEMWESGEETPSKKQKTSANARSSLKLPIELN